VTQRGTRISLAIWSALVIAFLWIPLIVIALYAFNGATLQTWPIQDWSLRWFSVAWNSDARAALELSLQVAAITTTIALVLGTMAATAVARFRFFGRETVSFLLVLPLALPGIITGLALNSALFSVLGFSASMWTIVIGHATFCVVVVYNNAVARLRRTSTSLIEASQDLGADGWQTYRFVVWPALSTALVAGGLLAFALSFDEVIVTTFTAGAEQTLPIWILDNIRMGQQLPVINVVAFFVVVVTVIPVTLAQRVMRDSGLIRRSAGHVTEAVEAAEIPAV
jgi:putative spermidine/putrescine transport system permease protein